MFGIITKAVNDDLTSDGVKVSLQCLHSFFSCTQLPRWPPRSPNLPFQGQINSLLSLLFGQKTEKRLISFLTNLSGKNGEPYSDVSSSPQSGFRQYGVLSDSLKKKSSEAIRYFLILLTVFETVPQRSRGIASGRRWSGQHPRVYSRISDKRICPTDLCCSTRPNHWY